MQFRTFAVAAGDSSGCDEMNRFLAGHRVLTVQREFIQNGAGSFWTFCVEYLDSGADHARGSRREKVDYKEVLSPAQFAVFSRLRECRKRQAANEGLPAFAVCTDEQMAMMARRETLTKAALMDIDGFGEAKAQKYADSLLAAHAGRSSEDPGS